MISCRLSQIKRILCFGAHSDDIEIGCGGSIIKLISENPDAEVRWFIFSADRNRGREARKSAAEFLDGARVSKVQLFRFHESYFPGQWTLIKDAVEKIRMQYNPDLIFTHFHEDRHQDHRVLSDLAWNAFRDHLILEYEVPKYDGDVGQPNFYVPLAKRTCESKIEIILRNFKTQASKNWFSADVFFGMLRIRGIECASRYAEAFYCRKAILNGF